MVMWNLVGHGVKWAARGIEAFSRTEAGKKTAEISSKAFHAAKDASQEAIKSYKDSRAGAPGRSVSTARSSRWQGGESVVVANGTVGVIVRYLNANEVSGEASGNSLTELVLLEMLQYTSELDRYLIVHENSVRKV